MSDDVTFEVDTDVTMRELRWEASRRWRGEGIDVMDAVSPEMRWLVILNYYYPSLHAREEQTREVSDVIDYLLSISKRSYLYYYRTSATVEFAGLASRILEPRDVIAEYAPQMVSGEQWKYVLVRDKEVARDIPDVAALGRWRFGLKTSIPQGEIERALTLAGGAEITVSEVTVAGERILVLDLVDGGGGVKIRVLDLLRTLFDLSADGEVFYYPSSVSAETAEEATQTVDGELLLDDDFRLGAEQEGRYRYAILPRSERRSWGPE